MKRLLAVLLSLSLMMAMTGTVSLAENQTEPDASAYAALVENATIDPAVWLDYSAGIEAGVYKWILSEDGSYYTLAAVDENGEPITSQQSAINVGANNEERGQGKPEGGFPQGGGRKPDGMKGDRGDMGGFGGGGTVYHGVYMNANIPL